MTHFLRLIRGVMLRGAQLFELWPDVLALVVFTVVMMALAIMRFRKRLDLRSAEPANTGRRDAPNLRPSPEIAKR